MSKSTIWRQLRAAGLITPQPKKRPKSSYIRFAADQPNELWQTDFTHWRLAEGSDVEILTFLDDHSRLALHLSCHQPVTGALVSGLIFFGMTASFLTQKEAASNP